MSPSIRSGLVVWPALCQVAPPSSEYSTSVTGEPPSSSGPVNSTTRAPSTSVIESTVIGPGIVRAAAVTASACAPSPAALSAVTRNQRGEPLGSPVTVYEVSVEAVSAARSVQV